MSYRFSKKVYNAEDGTRMLKFTKPEDDGAVYATFDLNILEDQKHLGDPMGFAVAFINMLQQFMGFKLTPEEIEYAVEDI